VTVRIGPTPTGGLRVAFGMLGVLCVVRGCVGLGFVAEARPFRDLDAGEVVELGELLAFVSDWLARDPNRLDASLYEFVGVPDYVGPVCTADELRAEVDRFARMLLGYAVTAEEL
jgi:hypothetical protein